MRAENAQAAADAAIEFAYAAVEEAEYQVLNAAPARMDADDAAATNQPFDGHGSRASPCPRGASGICCESGKTGDPHVDGTAFEGLILIGASAPGREESNA